MNIKCLVCGSNKRIKPSKANTAKFCSRKCMGVWRSENYRGDKSPTWKGGMVSVNCQYCGKTQTVSKSRSKTYRFCSYKCRGDWRSENWVGEGHPRFKGKWTYINPHYSSREHRHWVAQVKTLKGAKCQICGEQGKRMTTHHILPICYFPELAADPRNGAVLCNRHHGEAHKQIENILGVYLFEEIRDVLMDIMGRPGEKSFGDKLVNSGDTPSGAILSQASKEEGATTIRDAGVGPDMESARSASHPKG